MKVKCEYCGGMIEDTEINCPHCGATNQNVKRMTGDTPKTIEELKKWYQARHLPPYETTRFFIGIDYQFPKAFGIYQDGNEFVVYKNKADGTRTVRYRGTDEAYAVNEILLKLKSEILNQKARGTNGGNDLLSSVGSIIAKSMIPGSYNSQANRARSPIAEEIRRKNAASVRRTIIGYLVFVFGIVAIAIILGIYFSPKPTYYKYHSTVYCQYDDKYYQYDDDKKDYTYISTYDIPEEIKQEDSEYLFDGKDIDWDSDYSFKDSDYYDEHIRSHSSSGDDRDSNDSYDSNNSNNDHDYDWDSGSSWDSGGSDWDSDW